MLQLGEDPEVDKALSLRLGDTELTDSDKIWLKGYLNSVVGGTVQLASLLEIAKNVEKFAEIAKKVYNVLFLSIPTTNSLLASSLTLTFPISSLKSRRS